MKILEKWMDLKSILSKVTQTQKEKAAPSLSQACLNLSCMYVCINVCIYIYVGMNIVQSLGKRLREGKGRCYGKMNLGKKTIESRKGRKLFSP